MKLSDKSETTPLNYQLLSLYKASFEWKNMPITLVLPVNLLCIYSVKASCFAMESIWARGMLVAAAILVIRIQLLAFTGKIQHVHMS